MFCKYWEHATNADYHASVAWGWDKKSPLNTFNSWTPICPGAEALEAAPKVSAEPKVSPVRRLTTPVPAIDMVMIRLRIHAPEITETLRAKTAAYEDALKAFRRTLQEGKDGKTARNAASAVL